MKLKQSVAIYALMLIFLAPQILLSQNVFRDMQDSTVIVRSTQEEYMGTGVTFSKNINGERVDFVITCGHVIGNYKKVFLKPHSNEISSIVYNSYIITKEVYNKEGEIIKNIDFYADLIYLNNEEDMAVLKLQTPLPTASKTKFYDKPEAYSLGTTLYHVGCLTGMAGSCSLTSGILSKIGRRIKGKKFNQTTCVIIGGSSGGGMFLPTGEYIGMASNSFQVGFSFFIPIERMKEALKKAGLDWVMDNTNVAPDLQTLINMKVK